MTPPPGRGQRGFALLIVLVSLALLALLVGAVAASGRGEARRAANLRDAAAAEAAADGAVQAAAFHLLDPSATHWGADGLPRRLRIGDAVVLLRITNEAGKVNPNLASPDLLAALLAAAGVDQGGAAAIAAAIVAWHTPNAPAAAYAAAGRDYGPPGAKLQSLDELRLVLGMTPAVLQRLLPHLTLATDRPPDPAVADPVVARALAATTGQAVAPTGQGATESLVRVTVAAFGPGRARFVREAVLRLDPRRPLAPVRIMSWAAPPADRAGGAAP